MESRPVPSEGELTSIGAVSPLATVEKFSRIDPFWISGTGGVGVGVGVGSAMRPASDVRSRRDNIARAARFRFNDIRPTRLQARGSSTKGSLLIGFILVQSQRSAVARNLGKVTPLLLLLTSRIRAGDGWLDHHPLID